MDITPPSWGRKGTGMGTITPQVGLEITLREAAKELAWKAKLPLAAYLREIVEEYAAGKPGAPLVKERDVTVNFTIDEEKWAAARARAEAEGTSVSEVVRDRLKQRVAASSSAGQHV